MQISGICDSGHKIYFNGFSNFSVEWNCCFYCRSSTHHLFSINLSPEEDPPIYRYFCVKQVIWPIISPFQVILRIFFFSSAILCWHHLPPQGGAVHAPILKKIIFLSHWWWGPYQNCWSHICVSSTIHSCWGSYRNWWLAVVSSIFHRQFENSLISPRISSAAASSTLLRLFLYNLSRLDIYWAFSTFVPISFLIVSDFLSRNIFFHQPGMHNFWWVDQESNSLSLLLVSSVGSLGRNHIIGLLKGEWCIGEYYFGFQRDFKFSPVEIYIIMILDPHHLCHPGHVEHLPV